MWNFLTNASTLELIAVSVFIGATVASICVYINKNIIGKAVRALIAANACDTESAKTLSELGLAKNLLIRRALAGKGALRKLVNEVDDRIVMLPTGSSYFERDKSVDFSTARFYIKEENRIRAELRYSAKGSDLIMLIISIVIYFAIAWMIVLLIPYIYDLFIKAVNV